MHFSMKKAYGGQRKVLWFQNGLDRLICLNTWSPVGRAIWEGLKCGGTRGAALSLLPAVSYQLLLLFCLCSIISTLKPYHN